MAKPLIYRRILRAFAFVVGLMVILIVVLAFVQNYLNARYHSAIQTFLYEGRFTQDVPQLINAFYTSVGSYSQERLNTYELIRGRLQDTIASLDRVVVGDKSKMAYLGIRNVVVSIMRDCEEGIQAGLKGDQVKAAEKYDSALRKNSFIEQDSVALILAQIQDAETLAADLNQLSRIGQYFSFVLLVIMAVWIVLFVNGFAKKLSRPLVDITSFTGEIEQGRFDVVIAPETLERDDEIGMLGRAFGNMAARLKSNIAEIKSNMAEVQRANENMEKAQKVLETKNEELKRMNDLMVGRELKMVELKKRIAELERNPHQEGTGEDRKS